MKTPQPREVKPYLLGVGLPIVMALIISMVVRTTGSIATDENASVTVAAESMNVDELHFRSSDELAFLHSPQAVLARKHAAALRTSWRDPLSNPFFYRTPETAIPPDLLPADETPIPREIILRLSGVMRGRTPMALINGKIYRPGETVAEGWTLESIDTDKRSAVVVGPNGEEQTLFSDDKP